MFKELLNLWSEKEERSVISDSILQFEQMLNKGKTLYQDVTDALFLGGNLQALKEDVYKEDKTINDLEQQIRRKVVTALATDPSSKNITASLILMSVTKDAERIGDYAKNIFEVFQKVSKLDVSPNYDKLLKIRNQILDSFDNVNKAFRESDGLLAKEVLKVHQASKHLCDELVESLLENQTSDNAVAYALLARFFKRTLGHLSNIVTSVIMPIDKLDYFDEDHVKELKETLSSQ